MSHKQQLSHCERWHEHGQFETVAVLVPSVLFHGVERYLETRYHYKFDTATPTSDAYMIRDFDPAVDEIALKSMEWLTLWNVDYFDNPQNDGMTLHHDQRAAIARNVTQLHSACAATLSLGENP